MQPRYQQHEDVYAAWPNASGWNSPATDAEIRALVLRLVRRAEITPPARVLEIGCGMGNQSFPLADAGFAVTGVDISATAIAQARRRGEAIGSSARFVCADITKPWPEVIGGNFDVVLDGLCMHCIIGMDRRGVLEACRAALKPGGWLMAVTMVGEPRSGYIRRFFDQRTRCVMDAGYVVAQRFLGTSDSVRTEICESGFTLRFSEVVNGNDVTGDQDMLLCLARA